MYYYEKKSQCSYIWDGSIIKDIKLIISFFIIFSFVYLGILKRLYKK